MNPAWVGLLALIGGFLVWFVGRQNHSRPRHVAPIEPTDFHPIKREGLRGGLAQMALSEVFQYLSTIGASGNLVVTSGRRKGVVQFARGRILEAQFRRSVEIDALLALLDLEHGDFHFEKTGHPAQLTGGMEVLDVIMVWMETQPQGGNP
ncbi:MAG: hypothetical protein RL318_1446 [Fibrobacterota bacterium]|jgi:hypothetical protein